MIEFQKLTIQGFRSFNRKQVLKFGDPGFYLVTGQNLVEPELGANGVGKSTMLDALVHVLYGRTARGTRGSSVESWAGEEVCMQELDFRVDGTDHRIMRTRKPNSLVLDGKVVEQQDIDTFLGIDYSQFLHCVVFGQFNATFFDLSPAEKARVFSDVMRLHLWDQARKLAGEQARTYASEHETLERERAEMLGRIRGLVEEKAALQVQQEAFQETRERRLDTIEGKINSVQEELKEERRKRERLVDSLEAAEAPLDSLHETAHGIKARLRGLGKKHDTALEKVAGESSLEARARAAIDQFVGVASRCPTCYQTIPQKHRAEVENDLVRIAQGHLTNKEEAESERRKLRKRVDKLNAELEDAEQEREAALELVSQRQGKLKACQVKISTKEKEISSLDNRLKEEEDDKWSGAPRLKSVQKELRTLEKDAARLETKAKRLALNRDSSEYWRAGFGELRLWLIDEALSQFEVEANSALVDLGLPGWEIHFDVEREKASGGIAKGFTMSLFNDRDGDDPSVATDAPSGGETQRLRVAVAVGLSNLIRTRTGFDCNVELWDEPTAHLSAEGIDDMVVYLGARARQEKRLVYLVDHRSLDVGDFDGQICIVKEDDGSKIR